MLSHTRFLAKCDISSGLVERFQILASQMWLSGLYLLDFVVTPILCQRHQSILLSTGVTCQCIIIYFDEPTSPHPAVLTCCVQLWVS